ncbi:MAG: hypothetical protein M1833_005976 [Piccolia ochrophora]|nr:MAG: hypothetical protein M1833_005976 [Piccolia ochrophora]
MKSKAMARSWLHFVGVTTLIIGVNASAGRLQRSEALMDCLAQKSVPTSTETSGNSSQLVKPFNLRLQYAPAVVVLPTMQQHVEEAVICASSNSVKVQAKSGGHSYSSYSSGGQDGSMIIDLQNLQEISLLPDYSPSTYSVSGKPTSLDFSQNFVRLYTDRVLKRFTNATGDFASTNAASNNRTRSCGGKPSNNTSSITSTTTSSTSFNGTSNATSGEALAGIVKVGGGVRLGNLAVGIHKQGNRALPHGVCPGVGVGGHFTHGGHGFDSRLWGLALDTIVGMDVVTADGRSLHVTQSSYPDLFYAMRGAADSFGVVTTFYLQTFEAPQSVVVFKIDIPDVMKSAESATSAFLHLQDFGLDPSFSDRKLTFGLYIDDHSFTIRGMYFGTIEDFNDRISPEMLRDMPKPSNSDVGSRGWIEALVLLANEDLELPLTGYDQHDTFYVKSIVSQEDKPLTEEALKSFFTYAIDQGIEGDSSWFSTIDLYGGPDSQINAVPSSSASYSQRSGLWTFQNYGQTKTKQPPFSDSITEFITGLNNALTSAMPDGGFTAYPNYIDPELSPAEAHEQYFGTETYQKLVGIKKNVDPNEVFWNPQAVRAQPDSRRFVRRGTTWQGNPAKWKLQAF